MAHVPSAIAITAMRPEEYPLLVEFLYQAIHVSPGTPAPDRSVVELPELRRYIEGFGRPDDACMVARAGLPNGPQIVGAAWARIFPNNSAGYGTIDTATPEVSISLLPDWRNRGIGHRLMTALLDRLRTDGHAAASLSVQRTNANALHLYESLGFTIISEHDGELVSCAWLSRIEAVFHTSSAWSQCVSHPL